MLWYYSFFSENNAIFLNFNRKPITSKSEEDDKQILFLETQLHTDIDLIFGKYAL